ncbi:hypothetical protein IU453_26890 [Nocardia cyriacigeorgica]|uniref:hypothetical protein n=1 Tax=Nocardia cyriacigeorgica TaxID=135487 RepID=UPI001894D91C|nr:hypothetical protein [Nocardia cyriacigeorgica]MBF6320382.1 hypothetical protein [Nocardia cyriacigeorgica]MBF6534132.1 hypothetical protein [Nocardia cyriacigeorgica]
MSTTSTSAGDLAATEAALRRDFTRAHNLRMIAPHAESPEQTRVFLDQAAALSAQWSSAPDSRGLWHELEAAVGAWEARPETTAAAFRRLSQTHAAGDLPIGDRQWRTLTQAAELTGHHEPATIGSGQDSARWQPQPNTELASSSSSVLDRALGGRAAEPVSLDEVDAVIAETNRLLELEDHLGDRDTGADEHASLLPPELRATSAAGVEGRRTAALGQLQNLTAEHQRLAGEWDGPAEEVDTLVARLDSLLEAARAARRDAVEAGASATDIESAYRAGRDGHYQQPHPNHQPTAVDGTQPGPAAATAGADGTEMHALVDAAVGGDTEPQTWPVEDSPGTAPEPATTAPVVGASL